VEQLFNLPPLAAQKPSKLLAEMLRLCPRGQENNAFLNCLFLNKLPRELRILLSEADMAEKQALGARAYLFVAHNSKQAHDMVAAVAATPLLEPEGEDTMVAAVCLGAGSKQCGGGRQRGGSWRGKKKPGRGGGSGRGQQVSHMVSHTEQARLANGLCCNHYCFGAKAKICQLPATGQETGPGVSSLTLMPPTASFHTVLLCLPRAPSCLAQRVSLSLARETAWCSFDSRIRIFLGNFF
jgi:hypothetical protein